VRTHNPQPQASHPAQIRIWARPKLDMGSFVNSLDVTGTVIVSIDNAVFEMAWERKAFNVQPGRHTVGIWIRNVVYGDRKCCTQAVVDLQPGQVLPLRYTSGLTLFQDGTLETDPVPWPTSNAPTPSATQRGAKNCVNCNAAMPETAGFCPLCGQKQTPIRALSCTRCGRANTEGKFCRYCGGPMV